MSEALTWWTKLFSIGFILIIIGIVISVIAVMFLALKTGGKAEGGAVVIIGPFPIVVASSSEIAKQLLILAIVLVVILAVIMFLPWLLMRGKP